ncbi:MAG: hypothetical protein ACYDCK_01805 [Thermoplasmatota archaeon]
MRILAVFAGGASVIAALALVIDLVHIVRGDFPTLETGHAPSAGFVAVGFHTIYTIVVIGLIGAALTLVGRRSRAWRVVLVETLLLLAVLLAPVLIVQVVAPQVVSPTSPSADCVFVDCIAVGLLRAGATLFIVEQLLPAVGIVACLFVLVHRLDGPTSARVFVIAGGSLWWLDVLAMQVRTSGPAGWVVSYEIFRFSSVFLFVAVPLVAVVLLVALPVLALLDAARRKDRPLVADRGSAPRPEPVGARRDAVASFRVVERGEK